MKQPYFWRVETTNRSAYGQVYWALYPPSTKRSVPVIKDAASEARNKAALAMSSASPKRPNGYAVLSAFSASSAVP